MLRRSELKNWGRSLGWALMAAALLTGARVETAAAGRQARLVGVVIAKDVRPGERASGSIILYPAAVSGLSGLVVQRTNLDIDDSKPRKAVLSGYVVESGGQKRAADQNFVVDVPPSAISVHVSITRDDQPVTAVDLPIESSPSAPVACGSEDWVPGTESDGSRSGFRMPETICYAGLAVIAGDFSGDAQLTRVEVAGQNARIVAESRRYCYFLVPRATGPGRKNVKLHEGSHQVTFHETIPRLDLLQALEDEGSSVAEAAPQPSGAAAAGSDSASPALPLGLGFGAGSVGFGAGDSGGGVRVDKPRW
jgi:hypothetical protein